MSAPVETRRPLPSLAVVRLLPALCIFTEYAYDAQRLISVNDTNGTDYDFTYDDVDNIRSEKAGSTTTHYGYNMDGERCWRSSSDGTPTQNISRACATGPSGSTSYSRDADGNNKGLSNATNPTTYNDRKQVTNIDGLAQDFLDQGNDLRTSTANIRVINGPMGVTAYQQGSQTVLLSRAPSGQLLTSRPTNGTSLYYISEPNGNVAAVTDPFGYLVGTYQYSPYGKTSTTGLGHFNPFRYLGEWQETTAGGDGGHYKFGARYYNTSGMFTQPDALTGNLGDPRTMTAYNYAGADPINQADPSGYAFWSDLDVSLKRFDKLKGALGKVELIGNAAYAIGTGDWNKLAGIGAGFAAGFVTGFACTSAFGASGIALVGCGYAATTSAARSKARSRAH